MNIAIFHPQINNYGGGEYVSLVIAQLLARNNKVVIISSSKADKKRLARFFGLSLKNVVFEKRKISIVHGVPFFHSFKKSFETRFLNDLCQYDLIIDTGTNGWFTKKLPSKTLCYVHFPQFQGQKKGWKRISNWFLTTPNQAFQYDCIACNSKFTKKHLIKLVKRRVVVLYPPVEVDKVKASKRKKNIIVNIGRFTREKKQDVLINAFKRLKKRNWELHLIGSFQKGVGIYDKKYLEELRRSARGHNIAFHLNMPHKHVLKFLESAKIYWHARGYGENDPNEFENFGITTVEAMAAGTVPVTINKGAQPEIVIEKKNGFLWNTPSDLIKYTTLLMENRKLFSRLSQAATKSSRKYSRKTFESKLTKLIQEKL